MITLSSDFGTPYPAAMKGVLKSRCDAELIDVSHEFERQSVRTAAFWLREVLPYFPPAVHLVVVDPGVGTDRAALAVRAGEHVLVGPDNGVLWPAAERLAGDAGSTPEPYEIRIDDPASVTFHGRDVFAPAAAEVHRAGREDLGALSLLEPTEAVIELAFPAATIGPEGAVGEVLVVDGFGNAITNVPGELLEGRFGSEVVVDGETAPVRRTYAAVDAGQRLLTVGSHGNVELSVNRGRGASAFDVSAGETVEIEW